jgi:NAD(P)-dependent dehydrogenase (short-subunit alcohol dehydrogenase family)
VHLAPPYQGRNSGAAFGRPSGGHLICDQASRAEELTDEHFDCTIKTNLYGYFYVAKATVPHMQNAAPSS